MSFERKESLSLPTFRRGPGHFPITGERPQNLWATLRRLWAYFRPQKLRIFLVVLCVMASSVSSLLGPYFIGKAIDEGIVSRDLRLLTRYVTMLVVLYLLSSCFSFFQERLAISLSQNVGLLLRNEVFTVLHRLPLSFFDTHEHGDVMSRLTNDIDTISNTLATTATQFIAGSVTLLGTMVLMFTVHRELASIALLALPLTLLAIHFVARRTRETFFAQQTILGKLNSILEEDITGLKVLKAFLREEQESARFQEHNENLRTVGIQAQIAAGVMGPLMNVINNFSLALIAGFGGWFVLKSKASVGIIASFIAYSRQFTRPMSELATQLNMLQAAIASGERVLALLDKTPEPQDPPFAVKPQSIRGAVEFQNVSFSYRQGVPVLKNVSFSVQPGQVVALVGPTGAGKTTIVSLLARFYEPESGAIFIDGVNIREIERERLRELLGIVLQDTYLFATTVRENIRYGRPQATDEEVEKATRLANAEHFILSLPKGYDTVLSDGGENLSQGQRQLLALARAFLMDPALLILDEATSNVDPYTERLIQEAMLRLMRGRTTFIIAHRLSTIRNADLILVVQDGEIVEKGTHEELLKKRGLYAALYRSQMGKEEP